MNNKRINKLINTPFDRINPVNYDEVITELQRRLRKADGVINSGIMTHRDNKPYRVTICNTFHPNSAMDKDITLCADITEALKKYQEGCV